MARVSVLYEPLATAAPTSEGCDIDRASLVENGFIYERNIDYNPPVGKTCEENCCIEFVKTQNGKSVLACVKWFLPFFCCGCANLLMSFLLHIGTYEYIQVMGRFEHAYKLVKTDFDGKYEHLSAGLTHKSASFGSLQDPLHHVLGWHEVSLKELDAAALVLPLIWFVLVIYQRDSQLWAKTLLCHSFLAVFKGILACLTIVPDSIGWEACKARLGNASLYEFQKMPSMHDDFFSGMQAVAGLEWSGYMHGKPVRFCADMLYSGHTFVTCLYGFALVELTRKTYIGKPRLQRIAIQLGVSAFFFIEQTWEIKAVLLNRFHYTIDIVLAILMVLLWYTNGPVILSVAKWSKLNDDIESDTPSPSRKFVSYDKLYEELPTILPKGLRQRYDLLPLSTSIVSKEGEDGQKIVENAFKHGFGVVDITAKNEELPVGLQRWARLNRMALVPEGCFRRQEGDLWVPPACIPFSCYLLGTRQAIVSNKIVENFDPYFNRSADVSWCPRATLP